MSPRWPSGDLDRQISNHLRLAPQQKRAKQTVERLLDTTDGMIFSSRTMDRLTLEAAAGRAGVTQQSAYRYFANIDDLIRAVVRRTQLNWNARLLDVMTGRTYGSEIEIADAIVAYVAGTYENQVNASGNLRCRILRFYHDIEYDAAWTVSGAISRFVASLDRPAFRVEVADLAAGLVALSAMAKSLMLRDAALLRQPAIRDMMTAVLLAALGAPSRDDAGRAAADDPATS